MPVVFNNATQKAEQLSAEEADKAIAAGTHSIPMMSDKGQLEAIAVKDLNKAVQQGYQQPGDDALRQMLDYAEHTTPQAQARAGLRNLGNVATLGLFDVAMSKIAEQTKGITPEQYAENARKDDEANPGTAFLGKVGGLLVPGAALKGMQVVGGAAETLVGAAIKPLQLAESSFAARAMQTGAREFAQAALIQGGDEVSKQFVMEPDKSIGQSLIDIGLAGSMGAALGVGASAANRFVAQPLWKATKESHVGRMVSALRSQAEGLSNTADVDNVVARSGMEVAPEVKAKLTSNPALKQEVGALERSTSAAGRKVREAEEAFKQKAESEILITLGKTEKDIDKPLSLFEQGKALKDNIVGFAKTSLKQTDDAYKPVEEVLKREIVPANFLSQVRQKFDEEILKRGYHQAEGLGELKKINKILSELENVKSFDDLKTFVSRQEKTLKSERLFELKSVVSDVLRSSQKEARKEVLGLVAPNSLKQLADADALYSSIRSKLGPLGERLGIKPTADLSEFLRKISKAGNEEKIVKALTTSKDADLIKLLQTQFPELADAVRQAHLERIPLERAKGVVNLKATLNHLDNLSPEVKEFVLGAEKTDKLAAIGDLLERLGKTKESRMADSLIGSIPGGLGSLIGILTGGYPGAIAGYAIGKVSKEAAAAMRLAVLKTIASGAEMSGSGFRAMFEAANSAYRGAMKQEKAVSSLFKPAVTMLEVVSAPTAKSLGLLDRVVAAAETDPEKMMNVSGDLEQSMPEHAAALAGISARAVSYLASLRPDTNPATPLEPPRQPSDVEMARYKRALEIVEQPLMILKHVKEGTITPQDITTISTVYPELYDSMKEQVMDKMIEYKEKGVKLDYSTIMGLSLFLGSNLNSSLQPQNIMTNQGIYAPPAPPQAPRQGAPSALRGSKMPNIYSTPEQVREQKKSK